MDISFHGENDNLYAHIIIYYNGARITFDILHVDNLDGLHIEDGRLVNGIWHVDIEDENGIIITEQHIIFTGRDLEISLPRTASLEASIIRLRDTLAVNMQ